MSLTPKQQRFIQEYLIDLNGAQAAIRAGYTARRARVTASELLANRNISEQIVAAQKNREQRTEITQDRVLQELARLAFFDIRKLYREDGSMKSPDEWDDDTAAALAGLDVAEEHERGKGEDGKDEVVGYTKKAKVFDKKGALELCMRHLGMLNDKIKIDAIVKGSVAYRANMPAR